MPNPTFEPIIGSSFDALAGQRAQWAGFNANIDAANIARANAAEQNWNNYLANLATMQRQDWAQQMGAATAASQEAARRASEERQFEYLKNYNRARLAEEGKRTDAMIRQREDMLKLAQMQQNQKIEAEGQNYAGNYLLKNSEVESSLSDATKARDEAERLNKLLAAETAKGEKRNASVELDYKNQLKLAQAAQAKAEKDAQRKEALFQHWLLDMQSKGYELDESNQQIIHGPTDKKWKYTLTQGTGSTGASPLTAGLTSSGTSAPEPAPVIPPPTAALTPSTRSPAETQAIIDEANNALQRAAKMGLNIDEVKRQISERLKAQGITVQ